MSAPTCGGCRFWHDLRPEDNHGECRRRAPDPSPPELRAIAEYLAQIGFGQIGEIEGEPRLWSMHESAAHSYSYWPETINEDWCGEFQPKVPISSVSPAEVEKIREAMNAPLTDEGARHVRALNLICGPRSPEYEAWLACLSEQSRGITSKDDAE